jgi:hypothetical protein
MGAHHGQLVPVRATPAVERLARWWTSATQGERFETLRRSIKGDSEAPPLREIQLAIYLSEVEAGEVSEG